LNRPASEAEKTNVLALLSTVDADNSNITNELGKLEEKLSPAIVQLNREREQAIAKAKGDLGIYEDMTKGLKAELEKRRQTEISSRNSELKDYEKLLPAQAAFWETKANPAETRTTWLLVDPTKMSANGKKKQAQKLTRQRDGSITSTNGKAPVDFIITARSGLTNITGAMLEVLPDERLPRFGPGWAADANFVLSEFELKWGAGTNTAKDPAKFSDARADFSQTDFTIKQAIDGIVETGRNGWAMAGAPGLQRHTATFKLEHPIVTTNGASLSFVLKQHYGDNYFIGRFRLYLTSSDDPLDFGFPENVVQAARSPAGQRKSEEAAAIIDYYRYSDPEFWKRKTAAAKASEPLPVDPKSTELQTALTKANEPVHLDPYLVQLREDAKASTHQNENKRLTVVQDLSWALINSSGFLFNH
jgi:hypothetical protein